MPNGGLTQEELKKYDAPLKEVEWIFKDFAKKYRFVFNHSTYHDWPCVYVVKTKRSKMGHYYLKQSIGIGLEDNLKGYYLSVGTSTSHGFKELYAFIPYLRKKSNSWKHFTWGKKLFEFNDKIDPQRLKQLLGEAKQILDNFDESWLKEVK